MCVCMYMYVYGSHGSAIAVTFCFHGFTRSILMLIMHFCWRGLVVAIGITTAAESTHFCFIMFITVK